MGRRRLLAIAGALGMVAGLVTSGVAAQADTEPGPDSTYSALLATYSWSGQDTCYANGGTIDHPSAGTCTITQPANGTRHIAVCVQRSNAAMPTQTCSISQTNDTRNNYALVIQRIQQSTCAPTPAQCQTGTQLASIEQKNDSGSNFGGAFQTTIQSIGERDDPSQTNTQRVEVLAPSTSPGGLTQVSGTGSNFAAVGQVSQQSQSGGILQDQTATQSAGSSGSVDGIVQTTAAPGANAAALSQLQKQDLESGVATNQTHHAYQDGDITQDDGAAARNFAFGSQHQAQHMQGPKGATGATQLQVGDPRCCSTQLAGGHFLIVQSTNQFANNAAKRNQSETIIGNCNSLPHGCTVIQTATVNGTTTAGAPCNAQPSCHQGIVCNSPGPCTPCTTVESGTLPSCSRGFGAAKFSFGNRALAIAETGSAVAMRTPTTFRSASPSAVRSAPSVALLT
jgi:hypothetical protein